MEVGEASEPRIVLEDPSLLAFYKPPRMHCAPGRGSGDLCAWVRERYPETGGGMGGQGARDGQELRAGRQLGDSRAPRAAAEGYLLHRLDFETSGLVLFARDAEAFGALLEEQARGLFRKEYFAFCATSGEPRPAGSIPTRGFPSGVEEGAWAAARGRGDGLALLELLGAAGASRVCSAFRPFGPKGARVACLLQAGEGPRPIYVSELLGPADCALPSSPGSEPVCIGLRVGLARGFRHQIRAHLAWIGLPISGDELYGGAADRRLRLHAVALEFVHPRTGRTLRVEADP
jgi:23S rRNA pseudouridine1911/1915/1917 synthase